MTGLKLKNDLITLRPVGMPDAEDIQKGADELGVDLDEHIMFIVESMKPISEQIDLAPSAIL